MQGFNKFFNESLTELGSELGKDLHGPSPYQAVKEILSDNPKLNKFADMVDAILGVSHMLALVPPTFKSNMQILFALRDLSKHPKKVKYWRKLGYALWKSGKLTVANPLIFIGMLSPAVSLLPLQKQAIAIAALKFISTIYFYLSSLAETGKGGEKIQEALNKIKFALPEVEHEKSDKAA